MNPDYPKLLESKTWKNAPTYQQIDTSRGCCSTQPGTAAQAGGADGRRL